LKSSWANERRFFIGLADGWPRVVELTSGHGVVPDGHESANEGGEGSDTSAKQKFS